MGRNIDKFCEDLRVKLTNIDNGLGALKAKIDSNADKAEQEVRSYLDKTHARVEQEKARIAADQTQMKNWADQQKAMTREQIAAWKAKREATKLQSRAEMADRYAEAAADFAIGAVGVAEEAALEAWLARQDLKFVQPKSV